MNEHDLTESSVAFGKAGLDQNFTLFKIYTRKINDSKTGEVGQFSLDCTYPLATFEALVDPVGALKVMARNYLRHCVAQTEVPQHFWVIEFSPIMERYQIPSHLFLDTGRDRAWLY